MEFVAASSAYITNVTQDLSSSFIQGVLFCMYPDLLCYYVYSLEGHHDRIGVRNGDSPLFSYPDPTLRSCGWITSPLLTRRGLSGFFWYETNAPWWRSE